MPCLDLLISGLEEEATQIDVDLAGLRLLKASDLMAAEGEVSALEGSAFRPGVVGLLFDGKACQIAKFSKKSPLNPAA